MHTLFCGVYRYTLSNMRFALWLLPKDKAVAARMEWAQVTCPSPPPVEHIPACARRRGGLVGNFRKVLQVVFPEA